MNVHIHCPHCKNPIELVQVDPDQEVTCTACGSSFRLEDMSTTGWTPGGTRVGRFEIVEEVGHGGFGTVFKARDPQLDRTVAIKVPRRRNIGEQPQDLDRFLREARSVAQLKHPSIVTIHEVGTVPPSPGTPGEGPGVRADTPYLVSDFIEGVTLADVLTARRPPPREAAQLLADVAEALHYAHEQGVVHRDIKASNIMIRPDGAPVLMDFGLAKRDAGEITMTMDGDILGTPAYMSPEQARGEGHRVDGRSDVYSLGVILYQLFTGELPFRGNKRMLLHQVLHEEPRAPRSLNDHIPRDLETIALKAMAKEPGRRYATAREMAEDLRRWLAGEPIQARPVGRMERAWRWSRRNPASAALMASLVIGFVVATSLAWWALIERSRADREALSAKDKAKEAQDNAEKEAEERKRADREADAAWYNQYVAHMNRMETDWENANIGRILEALEIYRKPPPPGRKDLRGWEWHYQERMVNHELRTLRGHTDYVSSVTFSPDGALIVSASHDRTLKLWDAATGKQLRTFEGHTESVNAVAFSPDGTKLATSSMDLTVKLWEVATGQELRTLKGPTTSVAFSPDGARLASGGFDESVRLWDVATGEIVRTFEGHIGPVSTVAFSPDGARIASADYAPSVKLWDTATGQKVLTLKGHTGPIWSVAFSPDGTRLASASADRTVNLWNATTGQQLLTLRGHANIVLGVTFSPDGVRLASSSLDQTVKLWDVASGNEIHTLKGHAGAVSSVAFSPDGARLVSADQTVKLWDTAPGQEFRLLKGHGLSNVAFSPDTIKGTRLASSSVDRTIRLWDPATGQQLHTLLAGHTDFDNVVAFSPDGASLASAGGDMTVRLWDVAAGKQRRMLKGHTGYVTSVAFSPDSLRLASATADGSLRLWDVHTGDHVHALKGHTGSVNAVAFSPDGARLASAGNDKTIRLWDVATGEQVSTLNGHSQNVLSVVFSSDGGRLASAGVDGTVRLWDVATSQVRILKGHTSAISSVAFSADGARLASSSFDQTVKLWDAATGQELRTLRGYTSQLHSVAFSKDGGWLAAAGADGAIRLWDARAPTGDVQAEIAAVAILDHLFSTPLPTGEVRAAIQRDKIISEPARKKALELAERYKEETDPKKYHAAAWPVIRHPYSNVFMCQFALVQMNAACERAPDNADYRIALGVAQRRLDKFEKHRYQEALATLAKCAQDQPTTLAFLAMTQQHLGKHDDARATQGRLRELLKQERWAKDQQALAFAAEVEAALQAKATRAN